MREWLKDHALELASLVVAVVGVKGLTDFWARLREMFSSYSTEALFSCGLAAAAAAIVATYFARSGYRRRTAAKDAEIASLEAELAGRPTQEDVDELGHQLAAKDAEIASLEAELERRPTIEEVDARVVEAIGVFVDATVAKCDELSKTPDDGLRERVSSGEVSGFEARVLGEVLGLDAHPRRWLRSALEEGYVDVEDRVIGDYDRLGHFRNLVTAVETGLPGEWGYPMTRYVLNDGVRDVLESFPEVFELVDRDDEEIARIVSECGGKPYDPETAAYRRVSR